MTLTPSAHVDTFARDRLPAAELWPTLEFTLPELMPPERRLNAGVELVDVPAAKFGRDRIALRTPDGQTWTYGELADCSDRIARVLTEDLGMRAGNRVLLRSPNTPWAVACWTAVLKAGGIVVTTFAALRARELAPVVEKVQPVIALVDHRFAADIEQLRHDVAPDLEVATWGGGGADDLAVRASAKPLGFNAVDTAGDDVALLCPTSGSTGVPKITMHFHRDLLAIDATFGRQLLKLQPDDLVACTAPLAFTFGLGMLVVFALRAGASSLLVEAATPAELADLVARHGVTALATAPTAYRQILNSGKGADLRGLRVAVSAGEHIPKQVWERLRDEVGVEVIDGIGATEMLHIFISAVGSDIRPGTTGRAVPGFRATVLDDDGREVAPGVEGRLAVIGPVGCRYLDDPRQEIYVVNGWNVTGDTFVRDSDGYFTYRARTDNMIVSSGYNIGGPEVEAAIDTHPDVQESAVVAKPDVERGSIVCAFVVPRPGVNADAAFIKAVQNHVKATLAPFKYPREVRIVDSLPRNTSGKLQHFRLRQQVEQEAAAATAERSAPDAPTPV